MNLKLTSIFVVLLLMAVADLARAWEVDWSHHRKVASDDATAVDPGNVVPAADDVKDPPHRPKASLEGLVEHETKPKFADHQEFVILNTEHGFVPSNIRLHKGVSYIVHIVNVNESKKNVSFMLDAFNQHYATYYGEIRSFTINPDKEGVFEFECPETASAGKMVVLGPSVMPPANRSLSSEK